MTTIEGGGVMKKLSKQDEATRDAVVAGLEKARAAFDAALERYNEVVSTAWESLEDAMNTYNSEVDDARNFRDGIVGQMDDYIGERSEKWLESDNGTAYQEWKDSWESLSIEPIEIDAPEDIEVPDVEGADALRDLESEMAA